MLKILNLLFLYLFSLSKQGTKLEWKSRSIYQLLIDRYHGGKNTTEKCTDLSKYCGGTFKGLKENLNHIKNLGFNAIWISPIVKNTPDSYHGYHLISLESLNEHFGSEEDLKELIEECHKENIWVMLDVVANHVGPVGYDYKEINPFDKNEYYHEACDITDWNNQWIVENCRLADLPDLNHENEFVTNTLIKWIHDIIKKYNFDGIRIDTIPEVPKWFWKKFTESAGVFQLGEAFNSNPSYCANYQDVMDSVFNYPLYYSIENSFCGNMENLKEYINNGRKAFKDLSVLGVFVENHDNPRFLYRCHNNTSQFENAIVFSFLWEGIPVFYYGGEYYFSGGDDPKNRESLWDFMGKDSDMINIVKVCNKVRIDNKIWEFDLESIYVDKNIFVFKRGNVLVCVCNGSDVNVKIKGHKFDEGTVLYNAFNEEDFVTVKDGEINIVLEKKPKVFVKK